MTRIVVNCHILITQSVVKMQTAVKNVWLMSVHHQPSFY